MPVKIADLPQLVAAGIDPSDVVVVEDVSAVVTKRMTFADLAAAAIATQKGLANGLAALNGAGELVGPIVLLVATEADSAGITLEEGQLLWISDTPRLVMGFTGAAPGEATQVWPPQDAADLAVTGTLTKSGPTIDHITDLTDVTGTGQTVTIDATTGTLFRLPLGAASVDRTLAISGGTDGQELELIVQQAASADRTITWAANTFRWVGAAAPVISTVTSRRDYFRFRRYNNRWNEVSRTQNVG